MKFLFTSLLLTFFFATNAQQISSSKYIIIPNKFTDFDENQYQLNGYLFNILKLKNYEVLPQDKNQWPDAVKSNNCLALTADIEKGKSLFKNKLELIFKDCSDKTVAKFEGVSSIKEYDAGYQDALKKAGDKIDASNAEAVESAPATVAKAPVKDTIKETVAAVPVTTTNNTATETTSNSNAPATFKNGDISLSKSDLTDGSFLLIRAENSQVYAQFFPSNKAGVYHVKLINPQSGDYYTIGYFSGNTISVETRDGANKWKLVEFKQ